VIDILPLLPFVPAFAVVVVVAAAAVVAAFEAAAEIVDAAAVERSVR